MKALFLALPLLLISGLGSGLRRPGANPDSHAYAHSHGNPGYSGHRYGPGRCPPHGYPLPDFDALSYADQSSYDHAVPHGYAAADPHAPAHAHGLAYLHALSHAHGPAHLHP